MNPFEKCSPEMLKKAEVEGRVRHKFEVKLFSPHVLAGLLKFPPKFWGEITAILFQKRDDTEASGPVISHRSGFKSLYFGLPLGLACMCETLWQVSISDEMLEAILSNYQQGGSVRQLATYYSRCVEAGFLANDSSR